MSGWLRDSSPFGTSCIWRDNDGILPIGDFCLDVTHHAGFGEKVVNGDIKEALDLRSVEIHCDDMVGTGDGK